MGGGEIEWAKLADQFQKDTSYQESPLMEHEVLNTTRGFRGNPSLMVIPSTVDFRPNSSPEEAVCIYRAQGEYGLMLPPQPEFKKVLNLYQIVPAQLSPNVVAYMYSFLKLLQAREIPWSLTLFRSLFSWMAVPGYGGCLALRSRTRKAMFLEMNYILGDNPGKMSYVVGYGQKYPRHVHHRGASTPHNGVKYSCTGGWKWRDAGAANPNTITGAMVGGPNRYDGFSDVRTNYNYTEPTLAGNAGLVAALVSLTSSGGPGIDKNAIFAAVPPLFPAGPPPTPPWRP